MVIEFITQILVQHPNLARFFGLVIAIGALILSISCWIEVQGMPNQPELVNFDSLESLEIQGNEKKWVSFPVSELDCLNAIHQEETKDDLIYVLFEALFHQELIDDHDELLFENNAKSMAVLALFSEDVSCENLSSEYKLTGTLKEATGSRLAHIEKVFPFHEIDPNTTKYYDLCEFCGRENSYTGIALSMVFMIIGLAIFPLVNVARKKRLIQEAHL